MCCKNESFRELVYRGVLEAMALTRSSWVRVLGDWSGREDVDGSGRNAELFSLSVFSVLCFFLGGELDIAFLKLVPILEVVSDGY